MAASLAELQLAILALPKDDYFALLRWFADRDTEENSEDIDADAEWARHEAQRAFVEDAIRHGVLLDISFAIFGWPTWAVSTYGTTEGSDFEAQAAVNPLTAGQIMERCRALQKDDFHALLYWFLDYDNDFWDRQMEEDAAAGRLDFLLQYRGSA